MRPPLRPHGPDSLRGHPGKGGKGVNPTDREERGYKKLDKMIRSLFNQHEFFLGNREEKVFCPSDFYFIAGPDQPDGSQVSLKPENRRFPPKPGRSREKNHTAGGA
jgi:hypothetical protein